MPGEQKDEILSPFTPFFRADKLGHLFGFWLLCSGFVCTGRVPIVWAVGFCAALGGLTEAVQLLVPGRSALISDVVVNFLGALLGTGTVHAWRAYRARPSFGP